ncbi:MAG: flagellar brake protein [Nitrospirota bacterium]|nr:flagellar brake protein [Nitrospirota bacterium]
MKKLNCWEFKKCGRDPWGDKVPEFGICPAALEDRADGINCGEKAGRACWVIAGTFCGGKVQGTSASKIDTCKNCDFYRKVFEEEKLTVQTASEIKEMLTRQAFAVGLQLQLNSKWHTDVWTHLIGWEVNKFIVAELPFVDGSPINLYSDDSWRIKYIKDDNAFVFTTEVIHIQYFPIPLLFFRYPSDIRKMPIRKHMRCKINIPVRLDCGRDTSAEALISDISEGGCLIKVLAGRDTVFQAGGKCRISFSILNTVLKDLEVTVRNVHEHENMTILGAEFSSLSPGDRRTIASFIDIIKKTA